MQLSVDLQQLQSHWRLTWLTCAVLIGGNHERQWLQETLSEQISGQVVLVGLLGLLLA